MALASCGVRRDPGREPVVSARGVARRRADLDAAAQSALLGLAASHPDLVLELSLDHDGLISPLHPFVARRHEIPHVRLQAHGRALLVLLDRFLRAGWTFSDGDPQNFAWTAGGPILIDWGSPVCREPVNQPWNGLRQFSETVLFPLVLSRRTGVSPAHWLRSCPDGISAVDTRRVLGLRAWLGPFWVLVLLLLRASAAQPDRLRDAGAPQFERFGDALRWLVRRLLRAIDALGPPLSRWRVQGWAAHRARDSYAPEALSARRAEVAGVAQVLRPRRILDLGAHRGALLAEVFEHVMPGHAVALDSDPGCTTVLAEVFRRAPVTVLEADLLDSPALRDRLGAFGADLTIACGLVHHLALARSHGLEHAVRVIEACAGRALGSVLLLEWVPGADRQLRSLYDNALHRSRQLAHYSLDQLRALLSDRWRITSIPLPESRRILLRCERCR